MYGNMNWKLPEETPLHPMHTPEFVINVVLHTGRYPGPRRTGRTTAIALRSIARCYDEPRKWHQVRDHFNTTMAHQELLHQIHAIVVKLGFTDFIFNKEKGMSLGEPQ